MVEYQTTKQMALERLNELFKKPRGEPESLPPPKIPSSQSPPEDPIPESERITVLVNGRPYREYLAETEGEETEQEAKEVRREIVKAQKKIKPKLVLKRPYKSPAERNGKVRVFSKEDIAQYKRRHNIMENMIVPYPEGTTRGKGIDVKTTLAKTSLHWQEDPDIPKILKKAGVVVDKGTTPQMTARNLSLLLTTMGKEQKIPTKQLKKLELQSLSAIGSKLFSQLEAVGMLTHDKSGPRNSKVFFLEQEAYEHKPDELVAIAKNGLSTKESNTPSVESDGATAILVNTTKMLLKLCAAHDLEFDGSEPILESGDAEDIGIHAAQLIDSLKEKFEKMVPLTNKNRRGVVDIVDRIPDGSKVEISMKV